MNKTKAAYKVFQVLVVLLSLGYIAYKLHNEYNRGVFLDSFASFSLQNSLLLIASVFGVLVNWFFEAVKFSVLLKPIQKINYKTSLKAVLAGITVSIFTPKRIGDFGGRVFVLEKSNRVKGIFATILGSYSQLLITICIGLILLPAYLKVNELLANRLFTSIHIFFIGTVVILLSLFVYFNIPVFGRILLKFKFLKRYGKFIDFVGLYTKPDLLQILGLAALRYAVFSCQMFALLQFFGVQINFTDAFIGISQVYLYMSVMPTLALGELGVRGSLSVWVLGAFSQATTGILAASVLIWVLNLAIPAIIGNYFLLKFKY